ncbi:MAG: DUF4143 domain-containing protein, partial [Spirochaetales bacterium]|nr:DUF4143 domain-containing protein [Spirochaetales bacterium]
YRDQRSREIDFVIERGGALSFVEAKWQEHPNENDARTIRTLSQELDAADVPWRPGHHYVIGTPHNAYELSAGVKAIGIDGLDEVLQGDSAGG